MYSMISLLCPNNHVVISDRSLITGREGYNNGNGGKINKVKDRSLFTGKGGGQINFYLYN